MFPTPEKTILLGFIPDFKASINSPTETTSAPRPSLAYSLIIALLELDFSEKHINGLTFENVLLKKIALLCNCFCEYK